MKSCFPRYLFGRCGAIWAGRALRAAIEKWGSGGAPAELREVAARSYAKDQKISVLAATGVLRRLNWLGANVTD